MNSKKILKNLKQNKIKYTCILLFFLAFIYLMFFTNHVPFFWDEILIHEGYFKQSFPELTNEFFSIGSNSISEAPRTVYAVYFKTLFRLGGYNIVMFRTVKAVIFAMFIVLIFYFSNKYIKDYFSSLSLTFFIMFAFSLYVHTLVYAEPYLYSELFKIAAFYFFLKDFHQKKTSIARQLMIGVLGLLAIRTYQPAYSIPLILALYILFSRFKNLKRYFILLAFLFATNFPFKNILSLDVIGGEAYNINFFVIKNLLFYDVLEYIISPAISLQNLYYKPIIAIITFFGFWLFVIAAIIYISKKRISRLFPKLFLYSTKKKYRKDKPHISYSHKSIIIFLCAWIIGELPLWLILPEHAIRYANEILVPFMMIYFILISKTINLFKNKYKKFVIAAIVIFIFFACLTNIAYTTVFRAGWGSAFVGFEKVTDYIEGQRQENSLILYYSKGVAAEYYPMNISKPTRYSKGAYYGINDVYGIKGVVTYRPVANAGWFSIERLENLSKSYTELYVIKRVTGFLKNEMPPVNFDSYEKLELQAVIKGDTPSFFDKVMSFAPVMGIDYEPQTFYIYKYSEE